jgi:hypothetical protein
MVAPHPHVAAIISSLISAIIAFRAKLMSKELKAAKIARKEAGDFNADMCEENIRKLVVSGSDTGISSAVRCLWPKLM